MKRNGIRTLVASLTFALILGAVTVASIASEALVTNVFDNTFVIDALRDISAQTGVPIVADSTVQGQITLTLDNVPLEEALARILAPGGYVHRQLNGFYLVGAPDPKNPSFALLSDTEAVKLRYTKAEVARGLLADSFSSYVKANKDTNVLVVTAPEDVLERIKNDLVEIDRPIPQIMIEAMVVDVSKEGRKNLGLDWKWDHTGVTNSATPESGILQIVGLGADLSYIPAGGLNEFLFSLKAQVDNGGARVEANPRVATLDGQTAEIFVGRDRYYNLTAGSDDNLTARLESIKTGITLKLLPQVSDSGDITVRIEPEVSDVVSDATENGTYPVISRRHVSTTVRVKTGESIVLGGLLQRTDHKVKSKVPLLGDLPLLGLLFSSTKTVQEEGEVLIIITPYLMDGPDAGRVPKLSLPSAETSTKKR